MRNQGLHSAQRNSACTCQYTWRELRACRTHIFRRKKLRRFLNMWPLVGASILAISSAIRNRDRAQKDDAHREEARTLLKVFVELKMNSTNIFVEHVIVRWIWSALWKWVSVFSFSYITLLQSVLIELVTQTPPYSLVSEDIEEPQQEAFTPLHTCKYNGMHPCVWKWMVSKCTSSLPRVGVLEHCRQELLSWGKHLRGHKIVICDVYRSSMRDIIDLFAMTRFVMVTNERIIEHGLGNLDKMFSASLWTTKDVTWRFSYSQRRVWTHVFHTLLYRIAVGRCCFARKNPHLYMLFLLMQHANLNWNLLCEAGNVIYAFLDVARFAFRFDPHVIIKNRFSVVGYVWLREFTCAFIQTVQLNLLWVFAKAIAHVVL